MNVDQAAFASALLDAEAARPLGLGDGRGNPAGRRFDVYRNNVAVSLTEALETAFPILRKLVGEANFRVLAGAFLRRHPPASPLMMHYGSAMPAFLADFGPTAATGYLPDIARLELAIRESYHAADAEPLGATVLQGLKPDALMTARIVLAPSLRLIRSRWPIHAIWRFNTVDGAEKPRMAAEDVAVLRPGLDPEPYLLPAGGATFVASLRDGQTFGAAYEAALADTPEFELAPALSLLLGGCAITALEDDA